MLSKTDRVPFGPMVVNSGKLKSNKPEFPTIVILVDNTFKSAKAEERVNEFSLKNKGAPND